MKVATWNVNSIRAREAYVVEWLRQNEPDVVAMQETKVIDDDFPTEAFTRVGYEVVMAGQKSYNGVAIASRRRISDVVIGLPGQSPDADRRSIAAIIDGVTVVSVYVPNGKRPDSPDFEEKIAWLGCLRQSMIDRGVSERPVLLAGDFNVALEERDVWDPDAYRGKLHFHPREHEAMRALLDVGLVDAYRLHEPGTGKYSWWDYRGGSFHKNEGLRIDYVFLSRSLVPRCIGATMDRNARKKSPLGPPSDHVPVMVQLADV